MNKKQVIKHKLGSVKWKQSGSSSRPNPPPPMSSCAHEVGEGGKSLGEFMMGRVFSGSTGRRKREELAHSVLLMICSNINRPDVIQKLLSLPLTKRTMFDATLFINSFPLRPLRNFRSQLSPQFDTVSNLIL